MKSLHLLAQPPVASVDTTAPAPSWPTAALANPAASLPPPPASPSCPANGCTFTITASSLCHSPDNHLCSQLPLCTVQPPSQSRPLPQTSFDTGCSMAMHSTKKLDEYNKLSRSSNDTLWPHSIQPKFIDFPRATPPFLAPHHPLHPSEHITSMDHGKLHLYDVCLLLQKEIPFCMQWTMGSNCVDLPQCQHQDY